MDTGATLFLAAVMAVLVGLNAYGSAAMAAFIDSHIKDVGLACMALALVTLWNGTLVRRVAFYVALLGALYLLAAHWEEINHVF